MPYELKRTGSRYQVVNAETGHTYGKPTTQARAKKQLARLQSLERDWDHQGDGTYTRTVNGETRTLHVK